MTYISGPEPYIFFMIAEKSGSTRIISAPNNITAVQFKRILRTNAPKIGERYGNYDNIYVPRIIIFEFQMF